MDCARHIPPQLENTLLILRCAVVGSHDQSFPVRCSRISPVQAGQAIVERLMMCNFDATAVAMQIAADSSDEELDVKQSCQAYIESEEARWRERLRALWALENGKTRTLQERSGCDHRRYGLPVCWEIGSGRL